MFVKAAHRGKGIGIEILKELKKWFFGNGFSSMVLKTGTLQLVSI